MLNINFFNINFAKYFNQFLSVKKIYIYNFHNIVYYFNLLIFNYFINLAIFTDFRSLSYFLTSFVH
jgi:hypothetical protein